MTAKLVDEKDPILKQKAIEVTDYESLINSKLMEDLLWVFVQQPALGIAANQIGWNAAVFLMVKETKQRLIVINPKIFLRSDKKTLFSEGCLSFPGKKVLLRRPQNIEVGYNDIKGKAVMETLRGIDAVVFQHEYDHICGITMFDRLKRIQKAKKKRKKKK